jgi:type IX secretion system PorP/SprF family membrane protein
MIRLKINIIVAIMITVCTNICAQQEHMVTQFMFNKMSINPAFAGQEKYLGLTGVIRDQWNGFPGAPKTQMISANFARKNNKIGFGATIKKSEIGIFKHLNYSGIYSYKFLINDNSTLSMGIEMSGRNFVSDYANPDLVATQGVALDPSIPQTKVSQNLFNVGYGLYFSNKKYYLGASIPRLIKNSLDYDKNKFVSSEVRHLYVMGGTGFVLKNELELNTQFLMKFAQNTPFDIDINTNVVLDDKYTFGLTYRLGGANKDFGESIDLLFGFNITDDLMIGFSNDFTISKLRSYENGTIELLMQYTIGKKKQRVVVVNPRYF